MNREQNHYVEQQQDRSDGERQSLEVQDTDAGNLSDDIDGDGGNEPVKLELRYIKISMLSSLQNKLDKAKIVTSAQINWQLLEKECLDKILYTLYQRAMRKHLMAW